MFRSWKKHTAPSLILMYHRINTADSDTWQLCVSPVHLAQQMEVLASYTVVSLSNLAIGLQESRLAQKSVAISFDDGYLDNFINAKPILEKPGFPATFFFTNHALCNDREYWWDALEWLLLENNELPATIRLNMHGHTLQWDLDADWTSIVSEKEMALFASWLPWKLPPSSRHALFIRLSELIKNMPFTSQQIALEQLYSASGREPVRRAPYQVMGEPEIRCLAGSGQFEIGGHSANHTALAAFDRTVQYDAVRENTEYLVSVLGTRPAGYAYAHGSYNGDSINILQELGYRYACTTHEAPVTAETSVFELPRFQVKDWDGITFRKKIEQWFKS